MIPYKYKRPEGTLYKVPINKWNKTFARRGRWPFVVCEVYLTQGRATIQYVPSKVGLLSVVLSLPITIPVGIIAQGAKATYEDIVGVLFSKKYGRFIRDMVFRDRGKEWEKLLTLI